MYRQGLMAAGDYRQGGYQGDGLFSFIGSALKTVGGFIPGVGTALSTIGGVLSPPKAQVLSRPAAVQNPIGGTNLPPSPNFYGIKAGSTSFGLTTGQTRTVKATAQVGGKKKRRRMNVTNPKALRRAGRRVKGFEKLARRFIGFASPRKPKGRPYFRVKRRAA